MKSYKISRFFVIFFFSILFLNGIIVGGNGFNLFFPNSNELVTSQGDDFPTQAELFNGHTFDENYWNVTVFNNSKWYSENVENWTSWENNTWNLVWIKEGGFEMGMVSFLNKTGYDDGKNVTYTSPAHLWWQHFSIYGIEIAVAAMQCAWFGINDSNENGQYDEGEDINPFFYLGSNSPNMTNDVGIKSNPKVTVIPLNRTGIENTIIYTWGYNYTDIIFYVPSINYSKDPIFDEGWDYSDPYSYISGSDLIGNQTYISFEYKLEINTKNSFLTFTQEYESGSVDTLMFHDDNSGNWTELQEEEKYDMLDNWMLCLGTAAFIIAAVDDYGIRDLKEGELSATTNKTGLTEVDIEVGSKNNTAFEFLYDQNPTYDLYNSSNNNPFPDTNVSYATLNSSDADFIDSVVGVLHILGNFTRLVLSYVANQTHNFNEPVPLEYVFEELDPIDGDLNAAFFIEGFPEYGDSGGGKLNHKTIFKAYFPKGLIPLVYFPPPITEIPGFLPNIFMASLIIGIIIILTFRKREIILTH